MPGLLLSSLEYVYILAFSCMYHFCYLMKIGRFSFNFHRAFRLLTIFQDTAKQHDEKDLRNRAYDSYFRRSHSSD